MGLPLQGFRVLDLGQIYAGGYAGFLLAAAGADVIKVEPPQGENLRRRARIGGGSYPFAMLNGGKRSIVLDLKDEAGKDTFLQLVDHSDVVLENFAPGVMERLGLGSTTLRERNPRLVYGKVSGYGSEGPYRDLTAMDLTVQAMVGVMSTTGFPDAPPVKAGPAICDFMAGVHLVTAISMALVARGITGTGDTVEVTMQEATYPALASSLGLLFSDSVGPHPWRTGNRHSGYAEAPYNVFAARDGYVAVICVTDTHWREIASLIGGPQLADDPRFLTLADRVERMDDVDALVSAWVADKERAEVVDALTTRRVPCAVVRELPEVIDDENLWYRGMLSWAEHPELGRVPLNHSPLTFDSSGREPLTPSATLGQHTAEVLADVLGWTSDHEIEFDGR